MRSSLRPRRPSHGRSQRDAACLVEQNGTCVVSYPDDLQQLINDALAGLDDPPPLPATDGLVREIQEGVDDPDTGAIRATIEGLVAQIYPMLMAILVAVLGFVDELRPVVYELVDQVLQYHLPSVIALALQAIEDAGPTVEATQQLVNQLVADVSARLAALVAEAGPTVDRALADASAALTSAVESGRNLAAEAQARADQMAEGAQNTLDRQIDGAEDAVSDARTTATSVVQDTSGTLQDTINEADAVVGGIVERGENTATDGQTTATTLIENATDAVQGAVDGAPGTIEQAGPVPGTPFVFASAAGATSARVWWAPAADAARVNDALVRARRVTDGAIVAQQVVYPSSEGLFQSLQTGVQYVFEASARNAAGASPYGRSNVITAGALPPSAPTNLVAWPKNAAALVEWDPPTSIGAGITAYRFHAVDTANDSRSMWRDIPGRHTSIIENVPPPSAPVDPISLSEPRADTPNAPAFRFCAMAATAGGYGPSSCSSNLLTAPVLGPNEPPPCSVPPTDEQLSAVRSSDDQGGPDPVYLSDRLQIEAFEGLLREVAGARSAGLWFDPSTVPSMYCVAAVNLTSSDATAIRTIAGGPVDRIAFRNATYSRTELDLAAASIGDALYTAGEADFRVAPESDINRVRVVRLSPTPLGTVALASAAAPGIWFQDSPIGFDPQKPRSHNDPPQARDQFPPYRSSLTVEDAFGNAFCTFGFTMSGPTGLSGSTAGHCFGTRPAGGEVRNRQKLVGNESRNTFRESGSGTDFANIRLAADAAPRAEVIVNVAPEGPPSFGA